MEARVDGGEIASSGAHFIHLLGVAAADGDSIADRHPVALRAHQAQRDPVVVVLVSLRNSEGGAPALN